MFPNLKRGVVARNSSGTRTEVPFVLCSPSTIRTYPSRDFPRSQAARRSAALATLVSFFSSFLLVLQYSYSTFAVCCARIVCLPCCCASSWAVQLAVSPPRFEQIEGLFGGCVVEERRSRARPRRASPPPPPSTAGGASDASHKETTLCYVWEVVRTFSDSSPVMDWPGYNF
jgi:hypothetical protein